MAKSTKPITKADLQKRVAQLEKENQSLKQSSKAQNESTHKLKAWVSYFMLVVASFSLIASVNVLWIRNTLLDTPTWVSTTTEIIEDDTVRANLAEVITNSIYDEIELQDTVVELLPEKAQPLAIPISESVRSLSEDVVNDVLASDAFIVVWQEANTIAHSAIVEAVETASTLADEDSKSGVLFIDGDTLFINFRPILDEVKSGLRDAGIGFVPEEDVLSDEQVTFPITTLENLPSAVSILNNLNSASFWMPAFTFIVALIGFALTSNRRHALVFLASLSIALAVVNLQLIKLPGYDFSNNAGGSASISADTSEAMYRIITEAVVGSLRVLIVALSVVLLFNYLTGSSKAAVKFRKSIQSLFANFKDNAVVKWVAAHANLIMVLIAVITAILLIAPAYSSLWIPLVISLTGGTLILLVVALRQEVNS